MSGMFRNSFSGGNNTSETTPNKRYSFGAFCTSPGTLQDVTMDNSYHFGYRSLCGGQGGTSPIVLGRSIRDLEEQMSGLRKENFNLKLRIYFIEESMPGYKADCDGKDTLAKQLIDAKIEIEVLRKDITEKKEILKDAAQALTQMENMQKGTEAKGQAMVTQLQERVDFLEKALVKLKMQNASGDTHAMKTINNLDKEPDNSSAAATADELVTKLTAAQIENSKLLEETKELKRKLQESEGTISSCEAKIREQAVQNAELQELIDSKDEDLNKVEQKLSCQGELYNLKTQLADKTCELQEAEDKLQERAKIHDQACRTIQKLMQNINNQQKEINKLKDMHQQVTTIGYKEDANANFASEQAGALECSSLTRSMSDTEAIGAEANLSQKQRYELKIMEQEETIKHLRAEVKKKTANLQTLVNKELWEKNREIERLTKLVAAPLSPTAGLSAGGGYAPHELNHSFTDVEYTRALDRNKLLQRKVDVLIQHLSAERQNESVASQLRADLRKAKGDAESADKWRRECADVCGVLTRRLEELAGFLNTLLKNKDVLGVLAADRRTAMRRAVDRSLDLSKSLNMTLSISGTSIADQSLAQLCNLSEILCDTQDVAAEFNDGMENRTFNSHEDLHAQTKTIESLKAENNALKKELEKQRRSTDVKKERRSLPLSHTVQQQEHSESEAWSEPDRKVSMARIGLEEHSASLAKEPSGSGQLQQQKHSDTDSDALGHSHPQQLKQQQQEQRSRTQERITQLEQLIAQRDSRILSIQCQLVEADNRLKQEHLRVIDLTQELTNARQRNEALHADLVAIGEQESHDVTLANKIASLQQEVAALKQQREQMGSEVQLHVLREAELRNDMSQMQIKHELALSLAADQEKLQLGQLKRDMEALMQERLSEQQHLHEQALERDYVASSAYEELKQQLLELQRQYMESMRVIDNHQEIEQELKGTLLQNELSARALKKQLDESTLQASKAVLERTKANNDKLQLEQRVETLTTQLAELQLEHNSLQQELAEQQAYQLRQQQKEQQMQGHQQHQHQHQHQQQQQQQQRRQHQRLNSSDVSQSGYTSEEVPIAESATCSGVAIVSAQRMNNSSPDLGIESDAGRVSSVELSNAQHALLKIVELGAKTEQQQQQQRQQRNDNNQTKEDDEAFLLTNDEANGAVTTTTTTTPPAQTTHDCAKVDQENAELRRKLTRTKRALEDTYEKLRLSNKAKAQVERDIKSQILKTQNVLKKVRSNMENEL